MNENRKEIWSSKVDVSLPLLFVQPISLLYSDPRSALRSRCWFPFLHHNWSTVYPIWKFVLSLDRILWTLASDQNLGWWTKIGRKYDPPKLMFLCRYYICCPFSCSILTLAARWHPGASSLSCIIIVQPFIQSGSLYFCWIEYSEPMLQTKIEGGERK